MDFIHCNVCGSFPFGCQRRYCLTSCGHLVCENCTREFEESCLVCASKCRIAEISGQSPQEVKQFFMDGAELLKDTLKRTIHVMQFQKQHVKSLGNHYHKMLTAYEVLRNQFDTLKQENEFLKTEMEKLKDKAESLEQREQNRIGCGSIQNPMEIGIELFGNNKDTFPSFINKRNDPLSGHNSTSGDNCNQDEQLRLSQRVRNFGAVGSGRPVPGTRPSPLGHANPYPSKPSISSGYNLSQLQRDRLTLPYTPPPVRSSTTPSPVFMTMGKGEFLSPAIHLRKPGSQFNRNYTPGSGGSGSNRNDIVERLKKLNCPKVM